MDAQAFGPAASAAEMVWQLVVGASRLNIVWKNALLAQSAHLGSFFPVSNPTRRDLVNGGCWLEFLICQQECDESYYTEKELYPVSIDGAVEGCQTSVKLR